MKNKRHRIHIKRRVLVVLGVAVCVAIIIVAVLGKTMGEYKKVKITGGSLTYYIGEEQYTFNSEPFMTDDGVLYLPVEDILSTYGYSCVFDAETGVMSIVNEKGTTYMYIDKNMLSASKDTYTFNANVMYRGGVVYMPQEMFAHFSKDKIKAEGGFKFVVRPHRDLMTDTYIDDTYRIDGDCKLYNGVYTVGGKAAMEQLYYTEGNGESYAKVINSLADALPDVKVYNVLVPTMTEFYGPEEIYTDQIAGIRNIYEQLDERVMPVNVVQEMWPKASEHLYFATDHHWTQRGAYYAYKAFINAKGEEIADINEFPQDNAENFIGSWSHSLNGTPGESVLEKNAETLERFMPIVDYTGAVYLDMHLEEKWRDNKIVDPEIDDYTTFLGGDMPIIKYTTSVENGEKAVIIKESYGNAFATWAINNYEEVYVIDPRQWNGFGGASNRGEFNLVKFYNEVCQFDDLIVVSYPGSTTPNMRNAIGKLIGI